MHVHDFPDALIMQHVRNIQRTVESYTFCPRIQITQILGLIAEWMMGV